MDLVQLVVQFGAVGIAIYLIYCQRKERAEYLRVISNHINHNTKVLGRVSDIVQELLNYLRKNNNK